MAAPVSVTQWTQLVATHRPHLSQPQATVFALWSRVWSWPVPVVSPPSACW